MSIASISGIKNGCPGIENVASYLQGVSKKTTRKKSEKCSKIENFEILMYFFSKFIFFVFI